MSGIARITGCLGCLVASLDCLQSAFVGNGVWAMLWWGLCVLLWLTSSVRFAINRI